MFTAALDAPSNLVIITDFNSPDDIFWLGSAIFTTLTPSNVISANQFCIGDVALDIAGSEARFRVGAGAWTEGLAFDDAVEFILSMCGARDPRSWAVAAAA